MEGGAVLLRVRVQSCSGVHILLVESDDRRWSHRCDRSDDTATAHMYEASRGDVRRGRGTGLGAQKGRFTHERDGARCGTHLCRKRVWSAGRARTPS